MNEENTNETKLRETLCELEFLRGLDDSHVHRLAKLGTWVEIPEGTIIFNENEPASRCFIVVEGRVVLEICGSAVGCTQILTVGEGELLGWSSVLGVDELTATARALTATRLIEFNARDVLELCEQEPAFGFQFIRCTALALAKRLTATRLQLLDMFHSEIPISGKR